MSIADRTTAEAAWDVLTGPAPGYIERELARLDARREGELPNGFRCVVCCGQLLRKEGNYVCNWCAWDHGSMPLGRSRAVVSFARIDEINKRPRPVR